MLKDLNLETSYDSEKQNILRAFYIPALSHSIKYSRASAYFSASAIFYAAQGFSEFLSNEGTVRLILGAELQPKEFEAIKDGYSKLESNEKTIRNFEHSILEITHDLFEHRIKAVSNLIEAGRLEIKIAYRARGIFHKKIGENGRKFIVRNLPT